MNDQQTQTKKLESLRSLLERLGSAELTLAEAKDLRSQLARVLDASRCEGVPV